MIALMLVATLVRTYHPVTVAQLPTTKWTHVKVQGTVGLVKKEADGDWHIRLEDGKAFVVAEIIPAMPLPAPKKGQCIVAWGITRKDGVHGWSELHPVEGWKPCV